jgi:predicted AAA+ superfamily ATPase
VRRLDRPEVRAATLADADVMLLGDQPILLAEWQRVPALWGAVKPAADSDSSAGRFNLAGSVPNSSTHSGAARLTSVRMRPLTLTERGVTSPTVSLRELLTGARPALSGDCNLGLTDYTDLILASGFPGLQHLDGYLLEAQLDGYITRIVDSDMEEAGHKVRRPSTLTAWLRAYAAATSTTTSWEKIRNAATPGSDVKPAKSTTLPYINALTRLRIIDDLAAWTTSHNHLNRLTKSPKHHLADPALAARLVGLGRDDLLGGEGPTVDPQNTFLGALFESLAALSVRVFADAARCQVSHLRLRDGTHEVDLIVEGRKRQVVGLEVKLSGTVSDSDVRHLLWLRRELGADLLDAAVLTTGPTAYRRSDGIAVIPLGLLGP